MATYKEFHRQSLADRDAFWRAEASLVDWQTPFSSVLDYSKPPFAKWFVGGRTNLCHNAVDRHLGTRGSQKALVYISSETGETKSYTFAELAAEVNRFAVVLKGEGVGRGDRVLIYMPMIAEAAFAMLACARIGAVHSVVFGGFAAASLATRIDDAKPKVMVTADAGMRGGKAVPYKHLVDESIRLASHPPRKVIIVNRGLDKAMPIVAGRDLDYAELRARNLDAAVPCEWLESSTPSYILYTSGTTGKPKGVQRDTGGYAVALASSMRRIYCIEPGDTMFTTSDIGWVVGHSYIVYGPLIAGATTIMYEGLPIRPDPAIWWKIVADNKVEDDVQLAHRDPRAQETGSGVHEAARSLVASSTSSSPASRWTSRPRAGRPNRWASRSSTITGRPRRAGRSCLRARASKTRRASSVARRFRCTGTTSGCCARAAAMKRVPTKRPC